MKKMVKLRINWQCLSLLILLMGELATAQTWTNIGPQFGGYLRDFAFHPSKSKVILLGGDDSAGIWKSEDGGITWRLVSEELPNMSGWHIEYDKSNVQTVYACDLYNRYGVAKSTNEGESWTASANGLNSIEARTVSKIAILNQDTLFISTGLEQNGRTGDGIYKSADGGLNWIASGLQGSTCPAIAITETNRLIAATQGQGLMFSDDTAQTWTNHSDVPMAAIISQVEVKDSFVVVLTSTNGIYVSSDNGLSFTGIGSGGFDIAIGTTQPTLSLYSSALVKAEYNYTTKAIPVWNSMNKLIISQDSVLNMGIGAKGDTIMLGQLANSRLFVSNDKGESWTSATSSPAANNINDIAIDPNDTQHLFASLVISNALGIDKECLLESEDGGSSWSRKGPKESGLKVKFHPTSSDTMLCGTFTGGLYRSVDSGDNWTNIRRGTRVVEIAYHPSFPREILIAEIDDVNLRQELLKSVDGGNSFDSVAPVAASQIAYITNSDSIIAGVNTAGTFNGLFLSTDRGDSWAPFALQGMAIKTVVYAGTTIYAGTEDGEIYSINSSGTTNITGSWNRPVELTNIHFLGDTLFVGFNGAEHDRDSASINHGGVWYSTDTGQTWLDISAGLSCSQLFSNHVMCNWNNQLLVGTYGGSLFTLDALPVGIEESSSKRASFLVQPNPFYDYLRIETPQTAEQPERIYYQVFNANGSMIQYGVLPYKTSFRLDLDRLKPGVHLIRLILNQTSFEQKVVKK